MNDREIMRRAAERAKKPKRDPREVIASQERAARMTKGPKSCPAGQTLRRAYISASGKPVPAKCVKDRGGSGGKGLTDKNGNRVVVTLREGRLAQYGYFDVTEKTQAQRRAALRKAVKGEKDWLSIFRRLIYTSTLTKNTDPKRSAIFYEDAYWIKSTFAPKHKPRITGAQRPTRKQ